MSKKLAPGLIRLQPYGQLVPTNYDFDTKSFGLVHVKLPILYTQNHEEGVGEWGDRDLWEYLAKDKDAVATVLLNNAFLAVVHEEGFVQVWRSHGEVDENWCSNQTVVKLLNPRIPIGYIRTCPKYKDVKITPYTLFMDESHRVMLNGEVMRFPDAQELTGEGAYQRVYKALISTSHQAVYNTSTGLKYL